MTRPERIFDFWLESHQINHEHQKHFRIGFVDFFLPDQNTVVEVDGDYWHSKPRQIAKDKARDAYLKKIGMRVVRLKECDLYRDVDTTIAAAGL